MSEFKGDSNDSFGIVAGLGHLLIAVGVLATILALSIHFFAGTTSLVELLVAIGGGGVAGGIGLSFLNILFN